MAAARKAFAGVLAINKAVDAREIFAAIPLAGAWPGELTGVRQRVLDAVGGCRMAGKEIERARVHAAGTRFQVGVALHVGEETRCTIRIESGARRDADTDAIGFEFLRARKRGQCQ